MPVLGLTGNLNCGKSTVLELLKRKGAYVFDADKLIHKYYEDKKSGIYKKISVIFPEAVNRKGIDRKKLGKIVFSNIKELKRLEAIVHPAAVRDLKAWVNSAKAKRGIYVAEVPLLFENNLEKIFDGVILIHVKKDVLLKRIKSNLKLSKSSALRRLSAFGPFNEKNRKADFIINNSFGMETLKREIDILWEKFNRDFKGENKN
ncbi:MAG: dephospho-CoA kinase [Candidatus Omnitrophica bacterium]|nr:dephospho-CoA kinase [Candidatus Omnitrophota bacterium]